MSWMRNQTRTSLSRESQSDRAKEAILASVHRGLLLASASRRLQDPISSQRASTEAENLLTDAKRLCEETASLDSADERVRYAIESLTTALRK
ncbi:MAG TPA: hypothetical protein VFO35_04190 [Steroidobacteraceae bacterium]|nr:hypothetical protein [Steroidobacteraceae bacterium]